MTDYDGQLSAGVSLTAFVGDSTARPTAPGIYDGAQSPPEQQAFPPQIGDSSILPALGLSGEGTSQIIEPSDKVQPQELNYDGEALTSEQRVSLGDPFFEEIIVVPESIALGNVLSSQTRSIQLYNAAKSSPNTWVNFLNNAGAGLSITNLPSLPSTLEAQDEVSLVLQIDADGAPVINGTLDFVFNLYTVSVAVTGQRVVIFPFAPESPLREDLEFLTDVMTSLDGSEQRFKLRKNPRQVFTFNMAQDGDERRYLENLLYDWQSNIFGVGMWHEAMPLSQAATSGDLTLNVPTTDYADYRVGSLAFVISGTDRRVVDALEVESITSTSITFTSALNFDFPVGSLLMPMRLCLAQQQISGNRAIVNLGRKQIRFQVIDNDSNLGDASAFSTLNSKIFLDDPNRVQSQINDRMLKRLYQNDNGTGVPTQASRWDRSKRISAKGFVTSSRQELWELRQLLHELGGQLTPFLMPTFYDELQLSVSISLGSNNATFENVGFTQFVQDRRGIFRFLFADGSVQIKTVVSSSEVDANDETVVFDDTWDDDYDIADIERVEYIETYRSNTDRITITHANGAGYAACEMPVTEVFSE